MSEEIRTFFASLPQSNRKAFFKEHPCKVIEDAVEQTEYLDTVPGAGVCLICIVQSLEKDASPMKDANRLSVVINKFVGKTWQKPSKQKRHNEKSKHSISHFCTTKSKLCMYLSLWSLGVLQIGSLSCTAPGAWSLQRLQQ